MRQERDTIGLFTVAKRGIHNLHEGKTLPQPLPIGRGVFTFSAIHSHPYREGLEVGLFPCFYLVFVLYQEVDVIKPMHETMLLVAINVKMFAPAGSLVGNCLVGQIDLHFCLRILSDTFEEFCKERLADNHRQYEVVELVVLVNVSKEGTDNHTKAIAGNGPCCVLSAAARTEILAGHENTA